VRAAAADRGGAGLVSGVANGDPADAAGSDML